ncbi:MAG: OmpA family protein [Mariniphaga sp.]|nr:OmpA family protein [Mariniphaga sp.]
MKKLSLSVVVLFACYALTFAQDKAKSEPADKRWEIGINAGVANFAGEYNMFKDARFHHFNFWKSDMDFGFGALVKKNFSHVFAAELGWNYTNLTGTWKYLGWTNIQPFKTEVNEYDLNTVWNLNNLFAKNKFDRKIYWYAKLGVGATHIWKKSGDALINNNDNWKPTIPIGTGVAFRLNDNIKLNIGTQWSWVNTDKMDGHITTVGAGNIKVGNTLPDIFETKLYTHVGLSYAFGKKTKKAEPVVEAPKPEPKPELKPEPKPEPKPEVVVVKPAVIGNVYKVYFGFDKWNLNNEATSDLDKLAKDMNENPTVDVEIKSHTDSRGPSSYNMKLSEKRGKSVIDYLVSKGISASRVNAQAFGETQPVNKCVDGVPCTKAEYAANRRTETIVIE